MNGRGWWAASLVAVGCAASTPPASAPAPTGKPARYQVVVSEAGLLEVEIEVASGGFEQLEIEVGSERFVSALELREGGAQGFRPVPLDRWPVAAPACASVCTLRYRFDLTDAARQLDHPHYAEARAGGFVAPPTTFLLRPVRPSGKGELRFSMPAGWRFSSGIPQNQAGSYELLLSDLPQAPFSALGPFKSERVHVGASTIEVTRIGEEPVLGDERLARWAEGSARSLAALLGGFSSPHTAVLVLVDGSDTISNGSALGNGGASILVRVGEDADEQAFRDDWILIHEMVHVNMPGLVTRHSWVEEGLATFLEPIARAETGTLAVEEVWREWYYAMWQGQPLAGDGGLDGTRSWGRTYWGGAAFWLNAELEARTRTDGERGVRDCVRAVNKEGGTVRARWTVERFLAVCDQGIGAVVVTPLYRRFASEPVFVDLDRIFAMLGVRKTKTGVELDDDAPRANLRRRIVGGGRSVSMANGDQR